MFPSYFCFSTAYILELSLDRDGQTAHKKSPQTFLQSEQSIHLGAQYLFLSHKHSFVHENISRKGSVLNSHFLPEIPE